MNDDLVLVTKQAVARFRPTSVEEAIDQWPVVRASVEDLVRPVSAALLELTAPKVVPHEQLVLEQARRATQRCTVCDRPLVGPDAPGDDLTGGKGSICVVCADAAHAAHERRKAEEATLADRIQDARGAGYGAFFAGMPVAVFRQLVRDETIDDDVAAAATAAWPRFLDDQCRQRHAQFPDRAPKRVCAVCYLLLPSLLDPVVDREQMTHGGACTAALPEVEAMDYGTCCLWCNRWFRWDIPADAPVTLPYCSPYCFWASPEDPEDRAVPHPWPTTLYLPPPPLTPAARQRTARPGTETAVQWAADSPPPPWMAQGLYPGPLPELREAPATAPPDPTEAALLAALPGTTQELADRLGSTHRVVRRVALKLEAAGRIKRLRRRPGASTSAGLEYQWVLSES